jgi:hypothetical protein
MIASTAFAFLFRVGDECLPLRRCMEGDYVGHGFDLGLRHSSVMMDSSKNELVI